ncbi:hypothetical protein [Acuticoccus kandeliae]|uniref:hypothetical protein n=1 Tax=Acuticoccus kandeliae TaxID=2073160 RepID=UPI0013007763|nr:hypothetical protein [Acuticoccus kandeliae]
MAHPDKKRAPLSEADLANDIMGRNALQGDDQANVRNERQAVPGAKTEADSGPVESARLTDKDARAKAELGKGNRHASEGREGESN